MPTAKQGRASIEIAAPPHRVYALVADITRMGDWSPECYRCEWLDGAVEPVVGARFRGHNRLGRFHWETTAVIVTTDPGRQFAFTVIHDADGRETTRWHYHFEALGSGTRVLESFQFVWCPLRNRMAELLVPRNTQLRRGMERTLQRLKAAAEADERRP